MTTPVPAELVRGLYAGIRTNPPFKTILMQLAHAVASDACAIVIERRLRDRPGAVFSGHAPDSRRIAYSSVFGEDPFADLTLNRAVTMREHLGAERFACSSFMAQFMRDQGLQNVLGIDVCEPGGHRIRLRASRRLGDPDFGPDEKSLFEALAPHLAEAAGLFLHLDSVEAEQNLYATALNRLAFGAVVVDRQGTVLRITEKAQQILRQHDMLIAVDGGWRLAMAGRQRGGLAEAIRRHATPDHAGDPAWPILVQTETGEMLNLIVRNAEINARLDHPLEGAALITISDAGSTDAPSPRTLAMLYGLTPCESRLAALLGQGLDLDTASERLGIAKNTAKAHLRMIFAKTRVTRQSSLVRLVLRSVDELLPRPADHAAPPATTPAQWRDSWPHHHHA